jgi:glutathione peroxidase
MDPGFSKGGRRAMTRFLIAALIVALILVVAGGAVFWRTTFAGGMQKATGADEGSFYALKTTTLEGEPADLAAYRGRVALVVNVASKCGLTPQYAGLEVLYRELADSGFVILGFPSNDFMNQEPGSPAEIRTFCDTKYGVTFPLFAKVKVKGDDKCEVYRFLTRELEEPTWNFTKYLVDREGKVVARFAPRTAPDDSTLRQAIDRELNRAAG